MEWQRVAELHGGGENGRHGSGYLLSPGLALTARHVVERLDSIELRLLEPDQLGFPGAAGIWQPARVAWASSTADLALLAPQVGSSTFRALESATTLARVGGRAPIRVHALGFPRALLTATHSDTLQFEAAVNPWSGVRSESLLLDVRTTRPADEEGWKGLSGAAVFAGDRLVGVVEAVPTRLDSSTLRAIAAFALFDDPQAAEMLRAAGVERASEHVDAVYVDRLPPSGSWGGTQERYARAVVATFCSIDFMGFAVHGAVEGRTPALAAFTERRMRRWPDEPSSVR